MTRDRDWRQGLMRPWHRWAVSPQARRLCRSGGRTIREIPCMPTTRATRSTPTRLHARRADPVLDWSKLTRDQAAALIEVTVEDFLDGRGEDAREVRKVKFKLADKRGPLVDLGKHLGLFKERVELTGKDGGAME